MVSSRAPTWGTYILIYVASCVCKHLSNSSPSEWRCLGNMRTFSSFKYLFEVETCFLRFRLNMLYLNFSLKYDGSLETRRKDKGLGERLHLGNERPHRHNHANECVWFKCGSGQWAFNGDSKVWHHDGFWISRGRYCWLVNNTLRWKNGISAAI